MKAPMSLRALFILLLFFAAAGPVSAQSSATITKRLTDLEAKVTSLLARTGALETENAALAAQVTNQFSVIAGLVAQVTNQVSLIAGLEARLASVENAQETRAGAIAALQSGLTQEGNARVAGDEAARQYADGVGASTLAAAKTYADTKSSTGLSQAKSYTDTALSPISDKLIHFSRSGNDVYITGANLHIRNGTGYTYAQLNGLGNVIIGYNDLRGGGADVRTGSHNLVLGFGNNYSAAGGILNGANNSSADHFASVLGGTGNIASGLYSVVSGGYANVASGDWSTIGGGSSKTAPNTLSHVP